jgi:TPR repeat protein
LKQVYYTNETLPKNLEKAIYWMQKSAEQGNKTAIDWLKNNKF